MSSFIEPHLLTNLPPKTPILLALSGGADSRALLYLLLEYAAKTGAAISVAHVDHGIRGENSARDREFCRGLAADAGIPFYLLQSDVPTLAAANRLGLEEQARRVRYAFFETVMREEQIPILATAHNATDNAETLLFRMARGTGLSGLCGILPSRPIPGGILIRPLLDMTKEEILDYCHEHSLAYVTDETNDDTNYSRNRIRHKILPELTAINPAAVRHISSLAHILTEDENCLLQIAEQFLKTSQKSGNGIPIKELTKLPPSIANRVIAGFCKDPPLSTCHRKAVLALSERAVPHSSLNLPGNRIVRIENGRLILARAGGKPAPVSYRIPVTVGATPIPETDMLLVVDSENEPYEKWDSVKNIYKKSTTTEISFDRILCSLFVRPREPGDEILYRGIHKKVRKLQGETGVPPYMRSSLPLLCDDRGILWIPFSALRDGATQGFPRMRVTLFFHEKS